MAHNGYARTIRPVHTSNDGDTIFTMASQKVEAQPDLVGALAAKAMAKAIENACDLCHTNVWTYNVFTNPSINNKKRC